LRAYRKTRGGITEIKRRLKNANKQIFIETVQGEILFLLK